MTSIKKDKAKDHPEIKEIKNVCDVTPDSGKPVCNAVNKERKKQRTNPPVKPKAVFRLELFPVYKWGPAQGY